MPAPGRAVGSTGQVSRPSRALGSPSDQNTLKKRPEKSKTTQPYAQLRRESTTAASNAGAPRPPTKGRAYSAPMIPKNVHAQPPLDDDLDQLLTGGEPVDTDEIASDPFFRRYDFTRDTEGGLPANAAIRRDSSSDTEGPMSPTHVKTKQMSFGDSMPSPVPKSPGPGNEANSMHEINIGVLGAASVGKTTFVQRILELKTRPASAFSARKMAIDGMIYLVRLVEIPFETVDVGDDEGITWPDTIDALATPRIDGGFVLYDVMNQDTLARVPEVLNAVQKGGIPFALVSWKCDNHPAHRQVDPAVVEQRAKGFLGEVLTFQSSEAAQDMQKRCLSVMLRAIVSMRDDQPRAANARRRANSSAVRQDSHRQAWSKGHERASSEYSGSRTKLDSDGKYAGKRKSAQRLPGGTPQQSFLDLEESPGYDTTDSEDHGSDVDHRSSVMTDIPSDEKGYTFDQLVNRLLAQPMSKSDSKFSAVFLALYRQFAAPGQLLDAIISRFKSLARERKPALSRVSSQLRYLAILEQWIRWYPGDFAHTSTRRKMRHFVSKLQGNRIFAVAAREMITDLDVVGEDDDTDWACCDKAREKADPSKAYPPAGSVLDEDSDEDYNKLMSSMTLADGEKGFTSASSTTMSITGSTVSSNQTMLNVVESAQRQAKTLVPTGRVGLAKAQWHTLFSIEDDQIARELTRIDWVMFSSIRPRDLVRDVTLSLDQKKLCKSLENVNRMTEHFNHLSHWVTNFILLRDKPKHRALMLAKFMKIARKVRELNNYNALGAILAGINNTAVHRLASTKDQVPPEIGKDFMKLEILMGTQKSHFAYRLAWDNSSGERIPYLPLLRRDLVSAAQGNSTFVGDRKSQESLNVHPGTAVFTGRAESREAPACGIAGKERLNWRKFEIMGEVIVGVQRAQGTPYPPLQKNDEVRSLLLDVRLVQDDEDLYSRSVSLEAPATSGDKRRFNWFSK